MRPRHRHPPEDARDDRWLVSYADFVTLLFALFVVMYAVARAGHLELATVSSSLSALFATQPRSLEPVQVGDPLLAASPHVIDASPAPGYADPEPGDTAIEPAVERLVERFAGLTGLEAPAVAANNDWLEISLPAGVLFAPGSSRLSEEAVPVLAELAAFLGEFDNPVTVEGYTDNVPVESGLFPSNWELSAYRASRVARFLEARGIDRSRISAVGYGENHPVETNATPEGRTRNRRVDIVVARRGNIGRNRNTRGQQSAFAHESAYAHVRHAEPATLGDGVVETRTPEGGLLFTSQDPEASSAAGPGEQR